MRYEHWMIFGVGCSMLGGRKAHGTALTVATRFRFDAAWQPLWTDWFFVSEEHLLLASRCILAELRITHQNS